jgi:hypothetical protein
MSNKEYYSDCCGVIMPNHNESDLCPQCQEHCGAEEFEPKTITVGIDVSQHISKDELDDVLKEVKDAVTTVYDKPADLEEKWVMIHEYDKWQNDLEDMYTTYVWVNFATKQLFIECDYVEGDGEEDDDE